MFSPSGFLGSSCIKNVLVTIKRKCATKHCILSLDNKLPKSHHNSKYQIISHHIPTLSFFFYIFDHQFWGSIAGTSTRGVQNGVVFLERKVICEPKISNDQVSGPIEQNILQFQISVDNAMLVEKAYSCHEFKQRPSTSWENKRCDSGSERFCFARMYSKSSPPAPKPMIIPIYELVSMTSISSTMNRCWMDSS